jgi:hypothetical protein
VEKDSTNYYAKKSLEKYPSDSILQIKLYRSNNIQLRKKNLDDPALKHSYKNSLNPR